MTPLQREILAAYARLPPGQWCRPKDVNGRPREMPGGALHALWQRELLATRPGRHGKLWSITDKGRAALAPKEDSR